MQSFGFDGEADLYTFHLLQVVDLFFLKPDPLISLIQKIVAEAIQYVIVLIKQVALLLRFGKGPHSGQLLFFFDCSRSDSDDRHGL